MTLRTFEKVAPGQVYPPKEDATRRARIQLDRNLYLGVRRHIQVSGENPPLRRPNHNWFRRVPTFFAEYLYGQTPEVALPPSAKKWFDPLVDNLSDTMFRVIIDMLRYGTGVAYVDPTNPQRPFSSVQPDSWFAVVGVDGIYRGDIVVFAGEHIGLEADENANINNALSDRPMQIYKFDNESLTLTHSTHTWERGVKIGEAKDTVQTQMASRLVFPLFNGYADGLDGASLFDDIEEPILDYEDRLGGLGNTLRRNERPHLFGPDSAVAVADDGTRTISPDGMYFPLGVDDQIPGYLTWDSPLEAVKEYLDRNMQTMYTMAGLTPMLFDPQKSAGQVHSGVALRRLLIPFVSRVALIKRHAEKQMRDMIIAANAAKGSSGGEIFSLERTDITFEWGDEEFFSDQDSLVGNPTANKSANDDTDPEGKKKAQGGKD